MEFDLATGIISVIITATSAVTIYLIAELSRKGPSYDDIMASHRLGRQQPSTSDQRADSRRQKKLKKKGKAKSVLPPVSEEACSQEESTTTFHSDESPKNSEEVISVPEVEVAEEETVVKTVSKFIKKCKAKKKNRQRVQPSTSTAEPDQPDQASEIPSEPLPLHQCEIHCGRQHCEHISAIQQSEPAEPEHHLLSFSEPALKTATHDKSETSIVSVVSDPGVQTEVSVCNKIKKKLKKKKCDCIDPFHTNHYGALHLNNILPLIEDAQLCHADLQILIDSLLNKEMDSEWNQGKQDPMIKLKRQLSDMEKTLADDIDTINGLQAKLSTLRNELNGERAYNKTLKDGLSKSGSEIMMYSLKCQQANEENQSLMAQITKMQNQIDKSQLLINKFEEEKVLQQQMHIPHEQHHEAVLALQGQVNHLASQLQEQQTVNATLSVQLQESLQIQEEFRSLNTELDMLLNSTQYDNQNLTSRVQTMSKEIEDARLKATDASSRLEVLEAAKKELIRKNEQLEAEINQLQTSKLQKIELVDASTDGSKNNGNVNFSEIDHSSCLSRLEDKETLLTNLNSELNQKELLLEKLTSDMINSKNESNKKQTQIENLNVEITSLKTINSKITSDLNAERIMVSELRTLVSEKTDEVAQLKKEVDTSREKNNELRSKNWKLVEALSEAETSLKNVALKLEETKQVSADSLKFMEKIKIICLRLSMSPTLADDNEAWLLQFEHEVNNMVIVANNLKRDGEKNAELVEQVEKLSNMNTQYRKVIGDLETMLHELENKIQLADENQRASRSCNSSLDADD